MVDGVFDELAREQPPTTGSRSASTTTSRTRASTYDPTFDIEPPTTVRRDLLRPRLGRNGRREQEHDQDHRRGDAGARAGLLRLRLEEVRLADRCRTCASGRSRSGRRTWCSEARFVGCHQFGFLERVDVLGDGRRRRDAAAQLPARRRTRSGTRCRGRCRSRSSASASTLLRRSTPTRSRARPAGRPHQHRHADLLLRDLRRAAARRGDRTGSRRRSARRTAARAPRWSSRNFAAVDRAAGRACTGVDAAGDGRRRTRELLPIVPARRAGVRQQRDARR